MSRLGCCTLLAGCAVLINSAFGAYLPQLGPSPLRFRPSPAFIATVAMFPPLRNDPSTALTNAELGTPATVAPPTESLELLGPPSLVDPTATGTTNFPAPPALDQPPVGFDTASPASPVLDPPPVLLDTTPRITPQMLVDFFKPVLNGTNAATVTAPAGSFTPPQPLPSSSATYQSN